MNMRILEVFGEPISNGGQESFVVNTIWNMDRTGMKIDYLTPYFCDNSFYKNRIEEMGGSVYEFNLKFIPGKSRWNIYRPLKKFLSINSYDVLHVHSGSTSVLTIAALAAKKNGISKIITHSHCAAEHKDLKHFVAKYSCMPMLSICPTVYCACSQIAGEWKYSNKIVKNKLTILKNGVELDRFSYDIDRSFHMRQLLGITKEDFVVGHVGRFSYQKNHEFLIEIFRELKKNVEHCKLILVGTGEEKDRIIKQITQYNLQNDVILCGNVNNVQDYMMAMDVFLLPSRYEGLPIVGVEAQASGLPVITSDQVSVELKILDEVDFLSLNEDISSWVEHILKYKNFSRIESHSKLKEKGFDISNTAKILHAIYTEW